MQRGKTAREMDKVFTRLVDLSLTISKHLCVRASPPSYQIMGPLSTHGFHFSFLFMPVDLTPYCMSVPFCGVKLGGCACAGYLKRVYSWNVAAETDAVSQAWSQNSQVGDAR